MSDDRVTVGTYPSEVEAQIDRGRLEASGVDSVVTKDDCGGMRPHLAYTLGVKLVVAAADAEKAREILGVGEAEDSEPWTCACGEDIEAGFDACWKCGGRRTGSGL
jgi:hypothetical protein